MVIDDETQADEAEAEEVPTVDGARAELQQVRETTTEIDTVLGRLANLPPEDQPEDISGVVDGLKSANGELTTVLETLVPPEEEAAPAEGEEAAEGEAGEDAPVE